MCYLAWIAQLCMQVVLVSGCRFLSGIQLHINRLSCNFWFLPRDAMHPRYYSHGPCVCLSVTSRCSTKTAKRRITQITPHDSPGTLVFWSYRSARNSTGVTSYEGAECRWGGSKSVTFSQITGYMSKTVQDRSNRKSYADWWHCRWPWVPPNHPIFCILHRHSQLRNGWTIYFVFGTLTYRSKSHPAEEKSSLKGRG